MSITVGHTYTAYSHDACTTHTIQEHEIHEAVLQTIKQYARILMDFETVLKELDGINQIKPELYTDLKQGVMMQDECISLKSGRR